MSQFWSKMPLNAPIMIRCPNRLFIYGIVNFKIGNQGSWCGRINKIVEIANEYTPSNLPRWTYARVDYALRWLRKEGWLYAERPARNKPLVYYRDAPKDILPFKEEAKKPEVNIIKVEPVISLDYLKPRSKRPLSEYEAARDPETQKLMEEFDAFIGYKQPQS